VSLLLLSRKVLRSIWIPEISYIWRSSPSPDLETPLPEVPEVSVAAEEASAVVEAVAVVASAAAEAAAVVASVAAEAVASAAVEEVLLVEVASAAAVAASEVAEAEADSKCILKAY
jgi:hypothetical protein